MKKKTTTKICKNTIIKQFRVKSCKIFKKIQKSLNKNNLIMKQVIQMKSNLKH